MLKLTLSLLSAVPGLVKDKVDSGVAIKSLPGVVHKDPVFLLFHVTEDSIQLGLPVTWYAEKDIVVLSPPATVSVKEALVITAPEGTRLAKLAFVISNNPLCFLESWKPSCILESFPLFSSFL